MNQSSIRDSEGLTPQVRVITRLSQEVYQKFEKSLPMAVIDRAATDAGVDAAYKLGIQYILNRLRQDLVVD